MTVAYLGVRARVIDPFSPEADPGRKREDAARVDRRTLLTALAVLPAAAAACTHPRPACPTVVGDAERCAHRFCRYHRG
jgi:hypothetical protein